MTTASHDFLAKVQAAQVNDGKTWSALPAEDLDLLVQMARCLGELSRSAATIDRLGRAQAKRPLNSQMERAIYLVNKAKEQKLFVYDI